VKKTGRVICDVRMSFINICVTVDDLAANNLADIRYTIKKHQSIRDSMVSEHLLSHRAHWLTLATCKYDEILLTKRNFCCQSFLMQ